MEYTEADILEMIKALANPTRLQIMGWLVDPQESFRAIAEEDDIGLPDWGGVCVGTIQRKSGASPSLVSGFLKLMLKAGLLESRRHEKWTYYRINREAVAALAGYVKSWER